MSDPQIQAGANRQAHIETAKAAFFNKGGQVEVLVGIEARYPQRHAWNRNDLALLGSSPHSSAEQADEALAVRIRELVGKGAGITTMKHELRADERRIRRVAAKHGITIEPRYKPGTMSLAAREAMETARTRQRAALVPALARIAGQGMTIAAMADYLDVCPRTVRRMLDEYQITRCAAAKKGSHP